MRRTIPYLLIGCVLVFVQGSISAALRTVTTLNDSGAGSLRDTIGASGSGDTINFAVTGSIILTSASLSVGHNLTINGPGSSSLTITRQGGSPAFRIFSFNSGTSTLSDVTISNGSDSVTSGGIYNGGNLTLTNCVITSNSAGLRAGGVGNDGTLTLNNCFLLNNQSGGPGQVDGGGGVFNAGTGTLTMHNCTLSGNSSASTGGGVASEGTVTVTTSTFNDNSGPTAGAIHVVMAAGQDSTIQNCTFSHNSGVSTVRNAGDANLTIQSCTFSANDVQGAGSVYAFSGASIVKIGNTILNDTSSFFIKNGAIVSLGYNLSHDDGGGHLTATGDQTQTDPELDPYGLQYNGGFTDTIALIAGSPAIDAGKSFGLTSDQRGQLRPYDNPSVGNASGGDGSDIGAYEAPSDPFGRTTGFIVTTTADHDDGMCGATDCTLREAIARANSVATNLPRPISFGVGVTGTVTVQSELVIAAPLTISGPGARVLAISGGGTTRILNANPSANATISGLTIRDGNYATTANHGETRQGGAIFNQGSLLFNDCAFVNNSVAGASNNNNGGNGGSGQGGAIFNANTLTLNRCTFSGNSAVGAPGTPYSPNGTFGPGGAGGSGQGGAIFSDTVTELVVTNCTFAGNTANGGAGGASSGSFLGGGGGDGTGAAIFTVTNAGSGPRDIFSTTISGNTGIGGLGAGTRFNHGPHGAGNGGVFTGGTIQSNLIGSTIIAANTAVNGDAAPDVDGPVISSGFNLIGIGDQSTGFTGSGDQVGTTAAPINPHLGTLQNNGGSTDTMILLYGSSALDHGHNFTNGSTDQRLSPRPIFTVFFTGVGDGSDIGAVEMNLSGGTDSDGDGMSDDFEKFYGFNPNNPGDAGQDSDGDGMTNLQEFKAGTNPFDPNSRLHITGVAKNGNDFVVTFATVIPPKSYRLERKEALSDATWSSITGVNDLVPASVGSAQITDPGGAAVSKHFYRVRVLP